jgi:hypothetical protein
VFHFFTFEFQGLYQSRNSRARDIPIRNMSTNSRNENVRCAALASCSLPCDTQTYARAHTHARTDTHRHTQTHTPRGGGIPRTADSRRLCGVPC